MSGPLSLRTRSTIAVSAHSARQSQFWPWISRPLAEREGRISAPVQPSPGSSSAAFLFGAGLGDHFGARVDHDHVFERHAGAGGDAAFPPGSAARIARSRARSPGSAGRAPWRRSPARPGSGRTWRRSCGRGPPPAVHRKAARLGRADTDTKGNCVIWVMGVGRRRAPRSWGNGWVLAKYKSILAPKIPGVYKLAARRVAPPTETTSDS